MQPVTFTCLHCNNLMAVGSDLLGQQVRCPTCGQVVLAPAATTPPAYVLEPAPVQPPGVLQEEIPEIRVPTPAESPESIFGEDHDEDLFGSRAPTLEFPTEVATPAPSANGSSQTGFAPYPPPETLTVVPPPADLPISVEPPPAPFELVPQPPTVEMPQPPVSAATTPNFESIPAFEPAWQPPPESPVEWQQIGEDQVAAEPPAILSDAPMEGGFSAGIAPLTGDAAPQRTLMPERKKQSLTAITFLAPYAIVATLLAGWFGYQYYDLRSKHPLENIPDIVGENDPAKRSPLKQTSERTLRMPSPDQPLPDRLKVRLGESLRVGDLEVKPLKIEEDKFQFTTLFDSGATESKKTEHAALILHVRLKNLSSDVMFHPTDPFFDRQYLADQHRSKPYTYLEVGEQKFYGGPFNYLGFRRDAKNPRKRVHATGQENDHEPLHPGEERETRFYTFPDSEGRLLAAVHAFQDTLVWRLQLRRGLMNFKNRDYSMCAVVGVQFTAADVQKAN